MPASSFPRPRFLHFRRSRSRSSNPPLADATPTSSVDDTSRSSSSRPPSRLSFSSERDVNAAPSTSRPSDRGDSSHPRNFTGRLLDNSTLDDFGCQLSWASRPVTSIDAASSNTVHVPSPHGSVVQHTTRLAPPSDHTDSVQAQQPSASPRLPYIQATESQRSFSSRLPIPPSDQDLPPQQYQNQGIFTQAHNFTVKGSTFVDGNVNLTNNFSTTYSSNTTSNDFMDKLLKETIPGAASDSSARDPPPRCHPGTRLAILDRCLYFIAHCSGEKKMRWVVGAAGVGKSAIMQNVTESPKLQVTCHVSVFFSINGRNDGTKAIITLSYQLAAKFAPYRQLIEPEIARDPSLLRSSMSVQFNKFIIEPFVHKPQILNSAERILIIIDGLDECNKRDTQLELLRLISDFCITYPSSPLVWLIASRPERHITSFFTAANVMPVYEKEEIPVDSGEGRADVERFLREKLNQIKICSDSFDPHSEWPEERHLWKLASVSDGLFAYAHTVVGYIEDSNIGNPASQLSDVLNMIDNLPMTGIRREDHPMARLDVLYAWILSKVPDRVMIHAQTHTGIGIRLGWGLDNG
ncbi:hypothetical protein Agabi119p4_1424 [Agaricus bisporus var. burnettii]|uniref:Nephrocystin 3-like N-terminal domain-containing protein n=1 Tax=Agaricus bisporus var. burnettii TaxID=192524 RepID=A0A8H7F9V7_AGABI|nr:hypothetical protein Agabi119p4_1424 [Agaricus bisporus var. burnettii]